MKTYTLTDDFLILGIPSGLFRSDFPLRSGSTPITEAALRTEVYRDLLSPDFELLLKNRSPEAFELSFSTLVPVGTDSGDTGSALVSIDPAMWFPDPALSDESVPVAWNSDRFLYLCRKNRTAIRNLKTGKVLVNNGGILRVLNTRRLKKVGDIKTRIRRESLSESFLITN